MDVDNNKQRTSPNKLFFGKIGGMFSRTKQDNCCNKKLFVEKDVGFGDFKPKLGYG